MLQKDKIKLIVGLSLAAVVFSTYLLVGKEGNTLIIVSVSSLIIWIGTMLLLNKK
ncbi:MAG TPA: hypothetical protein VKZ45_02705 [Vicingaceae bacterium]|nr:hypothetical protein [Vicingaceae bacterium]